MDEFALIRQYFDWPAARTADGVVAAVGDDAALLAPYPHHELVVTTDTLVSGRHFPADTAPADIAHKALAVNASDLAAMGATPWAFTLAITLPEADPAWLNAFSSALQTQAAAWGIALVGGDTTRGPLSLTITALGQVPAGQALRRSGAQAGDLLVVSGTIGDAGLGLALAQNTLPCNVSAADRAALRERLNRPTPRWALGQTLRGQARAAADVSDGLLQDAGHLAAASGGLGLHLALEALPRSAAAQRALASLPDVHQADALWAGDDYELVFALPPELAPHLADWSVHHQLPLTIIGRFTAEPTVLITHHGKPWPHPLPSGFRHFGDDA